MTWAGRKSPVSSAAYIVLMKFYIHFCMVLYRLYGTDQVLSLEVHGITENTHTYSTHQDTSGCSEPQEAEAVRRHIWIAH